MDELYEKAMAFGDLRLWETLTSGEMFGVELSDGTHGYISVLGMYDAGGMLKGLSVYPGEEALKTCLDVGFAGEDMPIYKRFEIGVSLWDDICMYFDPESADPEFEDTKLFEDYLKRHDLAKPELYVTFKSNRRRSPDQPLADEEAKTRMHEAFDAAIYMAELLKDHTKEELGFCEPAWGENLTLPYLVPAEDGYGLITAEVAEVYGEYIPEAHAEPEKTKAARKKRKTNDRWAIDFFTYPVPMKDETREDAPEIFPVGQMIVDTKTGLVVDARLEETLNTTVFLNAFLDKVIEFGKPLAIYMCSPAVKRVYDAACEDLRIQGLFKTDPAMRKAMDALFSMLEEEQMS